MSSNDRIKFYGTSWCGDCIRSKFIFDIHNIDYDYVNIDENEAASDLVIKLNKGLRSIPTIVFPDGTVLVEPNNLELSEKLGLINAK